MPQAIMALLPAGTLTQPRNEVHIQEVRTEPVDVNQLQGSVSEISHLLRSWGYDRIKCTYGWGCNLPIDQLWHAVEIEASLLDAFVRRSMQDGVLVLGESDLHIEDQRETLEFLLCHESDVHFASVTQDLVEQVIQAWHNKGLTLYVSPGPKGSARPKEWKRLEAHAT